MPPRQRQPLNVLLDVPMEPLEEAPEELSEGLSEGLSEELSDELSEELSPEIRPAEGLPPAMVRARRRYRRHCVAFAYYLQGDLAKFRATNWGLNEEEVNRLHIPRRPKWPGLSQKVSKRRWRACKKSRLFTDTKRQVLALRMRGARWAWHDRAPDPTARKLPMVPEKPHHQNRDALRLAHLSDEEVKALRPLIQQVGVTGLEFRRLLGKGGFGIATLFRVTRRSVKRKGQRPIEFVVKTDISPGGSRAMRKEKEKHDVSGVFCKSNRAGNET